MLNTLPTGNSSLSHFVVNVDKEWLVYTRKALHLPPDGMFNSYDAVWPFLQATVIPWGHLSHLFLKKDDLFFHYQMVWLFSCGEMLNKLDIATDVKKIWGTAVGVRINNADGLHGLQEGWAEACWVRHGWHGLPSSLSLRRVWSTWYAHEVAWHDLGKAVRTSDVYVSRQRSSKGRVESHALEPNLEKRCKLSGSL